MRDPYLYPDSDVLRNLANIKNQLKLDEMEAEYCSFRLSNLVTCSDEIYFDKDSLSKIHYEIFQDIYEWAGAYRNINIEKAEPALGGISIEYAEFEQIEIELNKTLVEMQEIVWKSLDIIEYTRLFSYYMAKLWKIHPFREGNTRTIVTYCCKLIEQQGIYIFSELFEDNAIYMRTALVAASASFADELGNRSNTEYLERIIYDAFSKGKELIKVVEKQLNELNVEITDENLARGIHLLRKDDGEVVKSRWIEYFK